MEDRQLILLYDFFLSLESRYKNEAEQFSYEIQHSKIITPDLFVKYYTALIRLEVFDKIYLDVYNILKTNRI